VRNGLGISKFTRTLCFNGKVIRLRDRFVVFSYLACYGAVRSEFGEGGIMSRLKGLFFILFDPYFRLVRSAYCFRVLVRVDSKSWAC